jgi:diacylglycerol kinase family enzyme
MGGFETGEYVNHEMVNYYKVKAFRLVPDPRSILTVDGERIPTKPISVEVYHNVIRLLAEPVPLQ